MFVAFSFFDVQSSFIFGQHKVTESIYNFESWILSGLEKPKLSFIILIDGSKFKFSFFVYFFSFCCEGVLDLFVDD